MRIAALLWTVTICVKTLFIDTPSMPDVTITGILYGAKQVQTSLERSSPQPKTQPESQPQDAQE